MDPISASLSALMAGLGLISESGSQAAQQNLGYANLFETKRSNRKKEELATAEKVDARGNRVFYTPGIGWQIDLDPETAKILDAEDSETLSSLTEDASRNRNSARRTEQRALMGDEEFEKKFNEYKYRPTKSEDAYIGDAIQESLLARRKGSDEAAANTNKSLLRQGTSSNIPAVFKAARDAEADEFEAALLGGKRQGRQDFLQTEGAKDSKMQQELGFLEGLAGSLEALPQRFTNRAETLTGEAGSAMDELLSVIGQNDQARQGAMGTLMQAVGKSPNFSPLASSLGRLDFSGMMGGQDNMIPTDDGRMAPYPRPREEGIRARIRAGF